MKTRAARGDHRIELAAPASVKVGQKIEIRQQDASDKSLVEHLYLSQAGDTSQLKSSKIAFVSRVVGVEGAVLTLERPLRTDVDPKWSAKVRLFEPLSLQSLQTSNLYDAQLARRLAQKKS